MTCIGVMEQHTQARALGSKPVDARHESPLQRAWRSGSRRRPPARQTARGCCGRWQGPPGWLVHSRRLSYANALSGSGSSTQPESHHCLRVQRGILSQSTSTQVQSCKQMSSRPTLRYSQQYPLHIQLHRRMKCGEQGSTCLPGARRQRCLMAICPRCRQRCPTCKRRHTTDDGRKSEERNTLIRGTVRG